MCHFLATIAESGHSTGAWAVARLQAEAAQKGPKEPHTTADAGENKQSDVKKPFVGPMRDPQSKESETPESEGSRLGAKTAMIGQYPCIYNDRKDVLVLDTKRAQLETDRTASQRWTLEYTELKSIQKVTLHT